MREMVHQIPCMREVITMRNPALELTEGEDIEKVLDRELNYLVKNTDDAKQLKALIELNERYSPELGWDLSDAKRVLISMTGKASILNRMKNAPHIFEQTLFDSKRFRINFASEILNWLEKWFEGAKLSTEAAVTERQQVVEAMAKEYSDFIKSVKDSDVEKWADEIKNIDDLIEYTKEIMDGLYMDALLVFLQQYSIANVDILVMSEKSERFTKMGRTGFSLAYVGDPGTGKTFATDDLLRGNERYGIPPHGIIGKLRYAEGMTPKQFIAILEAYQDYPVDWIIPEFRDFFRYPGMVEKLKLVMERREVSDETRTTKIGPYKVTSFFVVNYNMKLTKGGYKHTMSDPNFEAVEDRMIVKLFINSKEREELILQNKFRMGNGEVDYSLANTLRKHITYTYHYFTKNKIPTVMFSSQYEELGKWLFELKHKYAPRTSLRILDRALQIAASAALVKTLAMNPKAYIEISDKDIALAKEFIKEELISRAYEAPS